MCIRDRCCCVIISAEFFVVNIIIACGQFLLELQIDYKLLIVIIKAGLLVILLVSCVLLFTESYDTISETVVTISITPQPRSLVGKLRSRHFNFGITADFTSVSIVTLELRKKKHF